MSQEPAMEPSADVEEAVTQKVVPANESVVPQGTEEGGVDGIAPSANEEAQPSNAFDSDVMPSMDVSPEQDTELPSAHTRDQIEFNKDEDVAAASSVVDGGNENDATTETAKLISKAKSTTVADMNACGDAGKLIRELTRAVKQTKEELAPLKTRLTSAKKEFQEAESNRLKPLVEAEKLVKSSIETFLTGESARRRQQRELQELSRQESIAEREKTIKTLEEEGKVEEARTLANEYPPELPPAPPIPVPKTIKAKATRRAEVSDLHALIRFIAEHPEHSELLRPATPALNAMARLTQGESPLPGVEFLTEQKVTSK